MTIDINFHIFVSAGCYNRRYSSTACSEIGKATEKVIIMLG